MSSGAKILRPVDEWIKIINKPKSIFHNKLNEIYGDDESLKNQAKLMCLKTLEEFAKRFSKGSSVIIVRSTGRVNIVGTHIEHRGGSVNPIAVKQMWAVVEPRTDDRIVVKNVEADQFPDEEFKISKCLPSGTRIENWDAWCHDEYEKRKGQTSNTWSVYVRAATLYFQYLYMADGSYTRPIKGMNMMFFGDIPRAAGLSSSSAVVMATVEAIMQLNDIDIEVEKLIEHCGYAEWYVGTRGGYGDHAAIKCGKLNSILHMTAFPVTIRHAPFPKGYKVVLANSLVEAKKRTGSRNVFNSNVASCEIGFMMIRKNFPQYADKLEYIRDVNPERLGVDESEIYRIVKSLPVSANRQEIFKALPEQEKKLHHVFRSHDEPEQGYRIRQICLYVITECIRADMVPGCLQQGDMKTFGELINTSHDGDRVTKLADGERINLEKDYSCERIDSLISDLKSGEFKRMEQARLWRQGGGYNVSVPETDMLVDIALATPGVIGAGLVGAGMGGSIAAVVEDKYVQDVVDNMTEQYYQPRKLPISVEIVSSTGGLCTIGVS